MLWVYMNSVGVYEWCVRGSVFIEDWLLLQSGGTHEGYSRITDEHD